MTDLLQCLRAKNRCLERFAQLSRDFLAAWRAGEAPSVEAFQAERESILKGVDLFDRKVTETAAGLRADPGLPELARAARALLAEREGIVAGLLALDEEVMSALESEQERLGREIGRARQDARALSKFRSEPVDPRGEDLDRKA